MNRPQMLMRRTASFITGMVLLWHCSVAAQPKEKGQSICYELQDSVSSMINWTDTRCTPGAGKNGAYSFGVLSSKPVFSVPESKKAWVVAVVGALGYILNNQPAVKVDELWLSDLNQMKGHIMYALPAALTKSLQRRIYSGQIDPEQMYAEIDKNLVRRKIEQPKQ